MENTTTRIWNVLRVGAALCFIGHGAFGILRKEAWLPFFALVGIGPDTAHLLMPVVGAADIALGLLALASPRPVLFAYMAVWALWTAALRPLTGDSFAELAERAGNYGVPLALLLMARPGRSWRAWISTVSAERIPVVDVAMVRQVLVATCVLLLAGHGFIGLAGSPLLATHYQALGFGGSLTPTIGALEISAALALALRPTMAFALVVCAWKLATESLFPVAGAPLWEFIERGGSYAAPLALALLLRTVPRPAPLGRVAAAGIATMLALAVPTDAPAQQAVPTLPDRALLATLREGGVILACRHAITDHDATDTGRERAQQRNLSAEGEAQARRMGRALATLRLPIGEVLTSAMYRNRETAELMFGRAEITPLLRSTPDSIATLRLFTRPPAPGTIRVLMTHTGVLSRHFMDTPFQRVPEGGCVLVRSHEGDVPRPVALVTETEWERLARAPREARRWATQPSVIRQPLARRSPTG